MRILIFGNSGSGKSTYARALAEQHRLTHLDLDSIVWEPGQVAVARPREAVLAELRDFIGAHAQWVAEGCYGDLVEAVLPACSELVFMNPGQAVCLEHNRQRPWEPHKYASKQLQDSMLPYLLDWVSQYYQREDSCSYHWHRRVFDAFGGNKRELTAPA